MAELQLNYEQFLVESTKKRNKVPKSQYKKSLLKSSQDKKKKDNIKYKNQGIIDRQQTKSIIHAREDKDLERSQSKFASNDNEDSDDNAYHEIMSIMYQLKKMGYNVNIEIGNSCTVISAT